MRLTMVHDADATAEFFIPVSEQIKKWNEIVRHFDDMSQLGFLESPGTLETFEKK